MKLACTLPHHIWQTGASKQASVMSHVDIALFDGFALYEVAAIIEIFQKANALFAAQRSRCARYDISLVSASGGRIASSSSVFVWTESIDTHRGTNDTHLLFIAGGAGMNLACRDGRLSNWLRCRHPFSEIVHPIAEGRLALEAAALPARYCSLLYGGSEEFLYPVRPLSHAPGAVQTALRIVEEDLGPGLAQTIAASMAPQRQAPFSSSTKPIVAKQVSENILASTRWLEANVDRAISIDDAAQVAAMSERTFLRRFKSEIGMTPSDYLLRARLNMSCRMLVETGLPIDKIARRCGINGGGQLAKLFRKYLATTPTDYRNAPERELGMPGLSTHN